MENNQIPQELQESLKRYRELLGYDLKKGKASLTERRHKPYLMEEDPEGGSEDKGSEDIDFNFDEKEEGGDKAGEIDFGGTEKEEGGDKTSGMDFGDVEGQGNEDFDFDMGGSEEETDEFGTADEFSAADELETSDDEVEEVDVTDIVKRADDAKGYAEKAVTAAEEGKNMIKDLMSKFETLQQSLGTIETVKDEVTTIKKDIQAQKPKEKLELRSLDSYPFNVKLTDYWNDEKLKDNYEITDGSSPDAESPDGQVKVWKLDPNDVGDFNTTDIKKSFVPESKSKKKRI